MLRQGLASRMAGLIVVGAGLTLAAVVTVGDLSARRLLEREIASRANLLAGAIASRIGNDRAGVEKLTRALAREAGEQRRTPEQTRALLRQALTENPEIYGAGVMLEPRQTEAGPVLQATYLHHRGADLIEADLTGPGYNYPGRDWYALPRQHRRPVWSQPYFDRGGGEVLMTTYAVPLLDSAGKFLGVVTADISIEWLNQAISALPLGEAGHGFLILPTGTFIAHRDRRLVMKRSIFNIADERGDRELREIGQRMVRGESGFLPVRSFQRQQPCYLAFAPVPAAGLSLGLLLARREVMAPVQQMTQIQLTLGAVGFALLLLVVLLITRSVTRPLHQLTEAARRLGAGRLDVPLPALSSRDEIGELGSAFSAMRRDLLLHIRELETTTAAKEKIESELRVARDIQMGLLPRVMAGELPDQVELAAMLEPAREIGGDFYDFFFTDQDHLALIIADVAGKGVPAALLMAQTHALARVFARETPEPAAVVSRLNEELARDNDAAMFVTLFYGRLDLRSGHCAYATAGHPAPLLLRPGGAVSALGQTAGAALGAMPGVSFGQAEVELGPADLLLLFTDGVTEAMNDAGELFDDQRLARALQEQAGRSCQEAATGVRDRVREFAAGAPQSDDIAMLAVRFRGRCGQPPVES